MPTSPIYIAIEGAIGVGKTTLAQLLQDHFEAKVVLETFEDNPFLASFYADPERYAFQAQVVFLLSRYHQQQAIQSMVGTHSLITDYLFAKDRLFARLNLHGDEWETYNALHAVLAERIVAPDLVVYLRASVDTLMERIRRRDRPYERLITREYMERLSKAYDEFFTGYNDSALLTLETDRLDVVTRMVDFAEVRVEISTALQQATEDPAVAVPPTGSR